MTSQLADLDKQSVNTADVLKVARTPETKDVGLPSAERLLTAGGDTRIFCNGPYRKNKYHCSPTPEVSVLAFGSSTASSISASSFAAVQVLHQRLVHARSFETPSDSYNREVARIRQQLKNLCGISDLFDLDIILAASGTDLHLISTLLAADAGNSKLLVVMIEATETGSGVSAALAGLHFDKCTPLQTSVLPMTKAGDSPAIEVATVSIRTADGTPRSSSAIDAEVESLVARAVASKRKVLLNVIDVSKTGLLAPSTACALALRKKFSSSVQILVDACQFRLAPPTLRAYLRNGFWVALTGSKFVTGPAFSGALLVPQACAGKLRKLLPKGLDAYSARADWPIGWALRSTLHDVENFGLLLRWEAALHELRAFRSLPESAIEAFFKTFASAIGERLTNDPAFERVPVPALDRQPLAGGKSWDQLQTIFPFLLRRPDSSNKFLSHEDTACTWNLLGMDLADDNHFEFADARVRLIAKRRCQLGQPVACGTRNDVRISALRICASARLAVEALSPKGRGTAAVIVDALSALDKAALLARRCFDSRNERP